MGKLCHGERRRFLLPGKKSTLKKSFTIRNFASPKTK
jgi:hypothetical protein